MKAWEYNAVFYDGDVYCIECLPDETLLYYPIFASSEWDYYPACCVCGRKHDYVGLTEEGRKYEGEE